jgi:hypothetical protein
MQSVTGGLLAVARRRCCYNTRSTSPPTRRAAAANAEARSAGAGARGGVMGTCPKCKQRIRKNGNHVKLGTTWYHKACPPRPTVKTKA